MGEEQTSPLKLAKKNWKWKLDQHTHQHIILRNTCKLHYVFMFVIPTFYTLSFEELILGRYLIPDSDTCYKQNAYTKNPKSFKR
jgi:hypothetical protein